jgi:hypothetical protein
MRNVLPSPVRSSAMSRRGSPALPHAFLLTALSSSLRQFVIKRLFHNPDREALELRDQVLQALTSNTAIRTVPTPRYGPDESN